LGVIFHPQKGDGGTDVVKPKRNYHDPGRDAHASGGEFCTPIKGQQDVQKHLWRARIVAMIAPLGGEQCTADDFALTGRVNRRSHDDRATLRDL
jgi:hypothetical protein